MSMILFTSRHLFNSCPTSRKMMELWSCLFKDCYPKDVISVEGGSKPSRKYRRKKTGPYFRHYSTLIISSASQFL